MPKHPDDRLTAWIHCELDPAEARAIEEHLEGCERCRAELAELQRTDALVAGLATVEAPDGLWRAVEQGLSEIAEPPRRARRRRFAGRRRWWIAAAAAALVVLAVSVGQWSHRPRVEGTYDLAGFLTALEAEPRQDDSREFALMPAGFRKIETIEALRAAGLGRLAEEGPTPDSELFSGRVLDVADRRVVELIFGNAQGPYILFVAAGVIEPDFGDRRVAPCPGISSSCVRVASESFVVFHDAGSGRRWVLVGRDHSDGFYGAVMRRVATALANQAGPAEG